MSHPIPLTVTRKQATAAAVAYWQELGINPSLFYSHSIVETDDEIRVLAVVSDDYTRARPQGTRGHNHPQGDTGLADEVAYMVTIRIVGDDA
jgi:hypothetical protein